MKPTFVMRYHLSVRSPMSYQVITFNFRKYFPLLFLILLLGSILFPSFSAAGTAAKADSLKGDIRISISDQAKVTGDFRFGEGDIRYVPVEKNNGLFTAGFIASITALILLLTFLVSWRAYIIKTRPVINIRLGDETSRFRLNPILSNLSATDAIGVVLFKFVVDGYTVYRYETDAGAYRGNWVWSFPANEGVRGNTSIEEMVRRIFNSDIIPQGRKLSIETTVYYMRWNPAIKYKRWSRLIRLIFYSLYSSPVRKWEINDDGHWVFVPANPYPISPKPITKRTILKQERKPLKKATTNTQNN